MNEEKKIMYAFLTIMGLGLVIFGVTNIMINEKKIINIKNDFIENNNSIEIYNIINYPENKLYYSKLNTLEKINYNNYQLKEFNHINVQFGYIIITGLGILLLLMSGSFIKSNKRKIKKKGVKNE